MKLLILGRERNLCLAEAEAVFGEIVPISDSAILVDDSKPVDIDRLGGAIKSAEIITDRSNNVETDIINFILKSKMSGKINFGISFYGSGKSYKGSGIKIKKALKSHGLSVRYVQPNDSDTLNAASVIYNKLTKGGFEILIVQKSDKSIVLARTIGVQDINQYSKRDYEKPCRDRKVGMLPPKLSQIMINLSQANINDIIVDPFCGSAGLLMEASLMGYKSEGSDISDDMSACSNKNIDWFKQNYKLRYYPEIISTSDATTRSYPKSQYSIVTEGFLGDNYINKPSSVAVHKQIPALTKLYIDFLKNLKSQTVTPSSVVFCLPFWVIEGKVFRIDIIDEIMNLGYTIHEFQSVKSKDLQYQREGQFTGRQIVVLN